MPRFPALLSGRFISSGEHVPALRSFACRNTHARSIDAAATRISRGMDRAAHPHQEMIGNMKKCSCLMRERYGSITI